MGTVIWFGVLLLLAVIAFVVRTKTDADSHDGPVIRRIGLGVSIGAFVLAFAVLAAGSYTVVDPGHRGIQVTLGDMNMSPLDEGFHWINPISDVTQYSIQMQKTKVEYLAVSKDTQEVEIEFSFNWKPDPSKLTQLIKDNTADYGTILFENASTEAVKAEVVKYPISKIADQRPVIKADAQAVLTTWLGKYGILIKEASITNIDFSEKYNAAIEQKQVQEQKALEEANITNTKRQLAIQIEVEAEGRKNAAIRAAEGRAQSLILDAEADAKAIKLRADAQAQANLKIRESLNPEILRQMWLDKWNGTLPHFLTAGGDADLSLILPGEVVGK
jgi:regulator of protease activity HflC (stomatin/prohibitin superfamily)